MMNTVISGGLTGIEACLVQVEVDVSTGLPGFSMVGSLNGEVREARERVQAALRNAGFDLPPMKVTVNLAPADIRKEGTAFDLPVAVGMLASFGYFGASRLKGLLFAGELGLDGEIKGVRGILPIVRHAVKEGIEGCIVPAENAEEAALIPGANVRSAADLRQLVKLLQTDREMWETVWPAVETDPARYPADREGLGEPDFAEVCGQAGAKRAAEIAAAGFHNLLMIGPPGSGKSMIAKRIPGILPPLTMEESLEVTSVYSVAGRLQASHPLITRRPFQAPHHTISRAALMGGSGVPRPGVISLAHRGVLFLDELPEFARSTLDSLRQPLEDKEIVVSRAYGSASYPADFMLVCAMNPCVCGYYPDRNRCSCTENEIRRYLGRVSGPILDRIDLCVEVLPVKITALNGREEESSADIRMRVLEARRRQKERFRGTGIRFNADIPAADMERYCPLGTEQRRLMEEVYDSMGLSARGYHRLLRVARSIADLAGEERISEEHLLEALGFRASDPDYWKGGKKHDAAGF